MTLKYAIDVAFSSATLAANRENPIAMAYGFASAELGGSWHENGQKVERVEGGTEFYFAIFDVAEKPGTVVQVVIDFTAGTTPFVDEKNPISVGEGSGLQQIGLGVSPGCNVVGYKWMAGPYTLINEKGTHEFTVSVSLLDSGGNLKEFNVDPEIQVEGPGPS